MICEQNRLYIMSISKKILYIFTAAVFILLIFCTFLSIYIADRMQPVVEVINPVRMSLTVSGKSKTYNTVIPSEAVHSYGENKSYVYIIRQRQGLFGIEDYAKLIEVEIIASDDVYTAIDDLIITKSDDIVLPTMDYLIPGATVKVNKG